LCGTYGDPMMCNDIVEICQYFKKVNPALRIGAHTNGSLRKREIYEKLAGVLDFLAFGIDGLEDTNHIYRRRTNFSKIIENATAFINAGGCAEWDFIVFRHNQHQVNAAMRLSEKYKFKKFNVKKTSRFFNKRHEYTDSLDVQDDQGNYEYTIFPPTDGKYLNKSYAGLKDKSTEKVLSTSCVSCNAKKIKEIYIGADGLVFPCGWLHDRIYGFESETHSDHAKIKSYMKRVGLSNVSCFHNSLEKIVNGPWFQLINDSWTNSDRLERCSAMCGDSFNLIGEQNLEISYKE